MTKVFLGIILFLIAFVCGDNLSKKYSNRSSFYKSLEEFNGDFISLINFRKDNLITLLKKEYPSEYLNKVLQSKIEVMRENTNDLNMPSFLIDKEKRELEEYFSQLGIYDSNTQLDFLKRYNEYFFNKVVESKNEEKQKGTLYKKIGALIGVISFILVL